MRDVRGIGRTAMALSIAGLVAVAAGVSPVDASATAGDGTDTAGFCNHDLDTQKTTCYADATAAREGARGKKQLLALWGQPNGDGKAIAFTANQGCDGDGGVYVIKDLRKVTDYLPKGQNWNNRASSLYASSGCKAKLFGRKNQQGKKTGWLKKEARLGKVPGGWNNRATSIRID